jgi:hypothetical protein
MIRDPRSRHVLHVRTFGLKPHEVDVLLPALLTYPSRKGAIYTFNISNPRIER